MAIYNCFLKQRDTKTVTTVYNLVFYSFTAYICSLEAISCFENDQIFRELLQKLINVWLQ